MLNSFISSSACESTGPPEYSRIVVIAYCSSPSEWAATVCIIGSIYLLFISSVLINQEPTVFEISRLFFNQIGFDLGFCFCF